MQISLEGCGSFTYIILLINKHSRHILTNTSVQYLTTLRNDSSNKVA